MTTPPKPAGLSRRSLLIQGVAVAASGKPPETTGTLPVPADIQGIQKIASGLATFFSKRMHEALPVRIPEMATRGTTLQRIKHMVETVYTGGPIDLGSCQWLQTLARQMSEDGFSPLTLETFRDQELLTTIHEMVLPGQKIKEGVLESLRHTTSQLEQLFDPNRPFGEIAKEINGKNLERALAVAKDPSLLPDPSQRRVFLWDQVSHLKEGDPRFETLTKATQSARQEYELNEAKTREREELADKFITLTCQITRYTKGVYRVHAPGEMDITSVDVANTVRTPKNFNHPDKEKLANLKAGTDFKVRPDEDGIDVLLTSTHATLTACLESCFDKSRAGRILVSVRSRKRFPLTGKTLG